MLSLRMRLALLYAAVFFATGLVLFVVPFFSVESVKRAGSPGPASSSVSAGPLISRPEALVVLAVVSLGLGWLIAGRLLRPLRLITASAREISATNLSRRLNLGERRRRDEFTELGETLDGLFGRLQASFDSQRHFVANASHELRTPLTAERALLQVALADPDASAGTLRAACEQVLALGQRTEGLIDALLTLASGEQGIERREPFDLAELTGKIVASRRDEAARRDVRVETALEATPTAGDPRLTESLIANLVDNALRHNQPGGRVSVSTGTGSGTGAGRGTGGDTGTGGRAVLSVRNTGPLIPSGDVDRLFQPFRRLGDQRVSRSAEGYGLGLPIVAAIARAHDATVMARARPEGGLDIDVDFPGP